MTAVEDLFDRPVHPLYSVMAFVGALIALILIIRTGTRGKYNQKSDLHFPVYCWTLFFCLQDGIWGLFAAHIFVNDVCLFVASTVFHLSSALTTYIWVSYMLSVLKEQVKRPKLIKHATGVLVLIQLALLVMNFFTKSLFFLDENGWYTTTKYRTILFYMQFAVYALISVLSFLAILKAQKGREKNNLAVVLSVNASPVFFGVFQMLYPDAPASSIGFSLGCIVIFTFLEEELRREVAEYKAREEFLSIIEEKNIELKAQQDSLCDALQMAESANIAKTSFLFNMSHDIRTPMNAIIGYTERALRYSEDMDKLEDSLKKIKTSSDFLLSIINEVLDMARIESGKVKIEESIVDICEVTSSLSEMIMANAASKDIAVCSEYNQVTHSRVWMDKQHVSQIMSNLLSNAIKYTKAGGEIWHVVRERPSENPGYAIYETIITDNGIGMSSEFLEKIYNEFEREKTSTVSGIQGTGLGMSIVKHLVDIMGGRINIESEVGQGTTVTVTMEYRIATEEEIAEEAKKDEEGMEEPEDILKGMHVLLVEDNEMNREIATEILTDRGIFVDAAGDGDIAVDKIKNSAPGQYDLVLMDVQMPRMNGYDATRAIRALENPFLANIPIIAMTANAFEEDKKNALDAGMNGHLSKPIDIPVLLKTISQLQSGESST